MIQVRTLDANVVIGLSAVVTLIFWFLLSLWLISWLLRLFLLYFLRLSRLLLLLRQLPLHHFLQLFLVEQQLTPSHNALS